MTLGVLGDGDAFLSEIAKMPKVAALLRMVSSASSASICPRRGRRGGGLGRTEVRGQVEDCKF